MYFLYVLHVLIKYISTRRQNAHNAANICSKNNILYINMKIIYFTLSIIGFLSYIYTYCILKYISYFISIEIQIFILIFFSIIVFMENLNLVYDLNNIKPINNQEHIRLIGSQAIEMQKNKIIIYRLTKLNEKQIIIPYRKKILNRNFNKSFNI